MILFEGLWDALLSEKERGFIGIRIGQYQRNALLYVS
jgi:hypothetical protein